MRERNESALVAPVPIGVSGVVGGAKDAAIESLPTLIGTSMLKGNEIEVAVLVFGECPGVATLRNKVFSSDSGPPLEGIV